MSENEQAKCGICDEGLAFKWTDTHGVAVCVWCGAPYRVLHYDDNDKPVEKEPKLLVLPESVEPVREYRRESGRRVCPGAFNIPGSSYESADREDFEAWSAWNAARSLPAEQGE